MSIDDYVYNGKFRRFDFERKTLNPALSEIKDVKETITGDFKMCDKHLKMIEKKYNKTWNVN